MNQIPPDVTFVHFVVAIQNQMPISPPVSENCTERTGRTSDAFAMTCGNSDFFHFFRRAFPARKYVLTVVATGLVIAPKRPAVLNFHGNSRGTRAYGKTKCVFNFMTAASCFAGWSRIEDIYVCDKRTCCLQRAILRGKVTPLLTTRLFPNA
jgi:hypothetical protein